MVLNVSYIKQSTRNKSEQSLLILLESFLFGEIKRWGSGKGEQQGMLPLTAIAAGSLYKDKPHCIGSFGVTF